MEHIFSENEMPLIRKYRIPAYDDGKEPLRHLTDLINGEALLDGLRKAVSNSDEITVYGDYDADGVMSVCILYSAFNRLLPGKINRFVNNRYEDGYNITVESMKKCLSRFPRTKTLITCDNGINAAEAVHYAMEQGVTVLVTDHHVQTVPLRDDCPAVDEKSIRQTKEDLENGVTPDECCGAELARRVVEALYKELGVADEHKAFLDGLYAYAGLATITDLVPMNPANHTVARRGLQIIQKAEGFWGFLKEEYIPDVRKIRGDTIGFYYGPLLNASSRITGEAAHAVEMVLSYESGNEAACRKAIQALVRLNTERKNLTARDDEIADGIIEADNLSEAPFILVWSDRFSEGINGLTASHITEHYRVPCAVLSPVKNDPEVYKGSARSVEGANLIELLRKYPELIQAGGHAMAAGLSVRKENLETVRKLLCEDLKGFQAPEGPESDYTYRVADLTRQDAEFQENLIDAYEPFGPGFEEPRLSFTGKVNNLWKNRKKNTNELVHAIFPMGYSADRLFIKANWWNHLREAERWYRPGMELHCSGKVAYDEYTNREGKTTRSIQITIEKILP